jgi:hypothetical protein
MNVKDRSKNGEKGNQNLDEYYVVESEIKRLAAEILQDA